ncbi:malto-oligosyltrehalose synthase, partial [candidate division FCPU426 bacterium]|nr:malto-oligosyltrehalose synthase [candidate division FCPU426 bacterium]
MQVPTSTYRLQFNPEYTFSMAAAHLEYLANLGVSHLYASPIFKARPGSRHGYDIVDHNIINPELGGGEEFEKLVASAQAAGLAWVQDVVPNHMAFAPENQVLMDVLENGVHSKFRDFFDITWDHPYESMRGRLLAPFLGDFYGRALERGEIKLVYDDQGLAVRYYDLRLPIRVESYAKIFAPQLTLLKRRLGKDHPDFIKIQGLVSLAQNRELSGTEAEHSSQVKFIKSVLWELYSQNEEVRNHVNKRLDTFNGTPGDPESFNALDQLLSEQRFRLAFWKVATEEINYRRFFNINGLVCLRVEDETV